jgi:hypothetical protein
MTQNGHFVQIDKWSRVNLKKTALMAEILGGIGIIVSILYLAFEVSESSKNTRISNELALLQINADLRTLMTSDAGAGELVSKGSNNIGSLSDVEMDRFYLWTQHLFDIWEQTVTLQIRGAIETDVGARWTEGYCAYMSRPGYRALWESDVQGLAHPNFREVVETCFSK